MKKTIWILALGLGMLSCSPQNEETHEKETPEVVVEETYTSWDLLTRYSTEGEELLKDIKGKKITITNCLVEGGSTTYISLNFRGYNGFEAMAYSRPEEGYKVMIDGQLLPEYTGEYFYLDLVGGVGENIAEIQPYDIIYDDDKNPTAGRTVRYHSVITIETVGDSISIGNDHTLKVKGGKVIAHINYK